MEKPYDIAIIGGGINGCGCAADAALRGLSVVLCEKSDLASQTSSNSSKLIHGGLRYLEQFDFSLVKKALDERQTLLKIAPNLVHPLQFILPIRPKLRSIWLIRLGLFIYDHLSNLNRLPRSKYLNRKKNSNYFKPLLPLIDQGFSYYDCITDDARLTIANALQAQNHGANILTRTEVIDVKIIDDLWNLTIQTRNQTPRTIKAKALINATGPWVASINQMLKIPNQHQLTLVKGSHIVLQKLYDGDYAYVLQNDDHRIVFALPYFGHTLVGTTDILLSEPIENLNISNEETEYLLNVIGDYFTNKPSRNQIIASWSGVRPLIAHTNKNASTLSRDYIYHFSTLPAPNVTIYGGKITTYRRLAEEVINQFQSIFPTMGSSITSETLLPGSLSLKNQYPWLDEAILSHYTTTYGSRTDLILHNCHTMQDLGEHFIGPLYQREVDYLLDNEWATSVEDILWRHTKLGLEFNANDLPKLDRYLLSRGMSN